MIVQSQPKNKKKFALWITVKWAFVAQNYKTPEMCSFHIKQQFELKHKLLNNFSPTAGDLLLRAESPINLSHEIKPLFSCVPFDIHRRWDRNSREAFRQVPWWLRFVSLSSCIISEKKSKALCFNCWYFAIVKRKERDKTRSCFCIFRMLSKMGWGTHLLSRTVSLV